MQYNRNFRFCIRNFTLRSWDFKFLSLIKSFFDSSFCIINAQAMDVRLSKAIDQLTNIQGHHFHIQSWRITWGTNSEFSSKYGIKRAKSNCPIFEPHWDNPRAAPNELLVKKNINILSIKPD